MKGQRLDRLTKGAFGGPDEIRTHYLLSANQVLSQIELQAHILYSIYILVMYLFYTNKNDHKIQQVILRLSGLSAYGI